MKQTIFLCGFMGTGKTTVGQVLAKRWGVSYFDTDEVIVELCGMPIPEIFRQKGESFFRQLETQSLREIAKAECAVVSTGGGIVLQPDNVALIQDIGTLIYLNTSFALCYERIKGDQNRPNAYTRSKEELFALYESRKAIYQQVCDLEILCEDKIEPVVEQITQNLSKFS